MPYAISHWPATVYPGELDAECPEAREVIDVLLIAMMQEGPSPEGYAVKTLGRKMDGLWQVNLKVEKRQVRLLYAPYGESIVLFRIHKKGSPQEQKRAYELAGRRKREYEHARRLIGQSSNDRNRTIH
jgi:hypothetical protein